MEQNAAAGLPHGALVRAFGYETDRVTVVESEAVVIRQLAERFPAGAHHGSPAYTRMTAPARAIPSGVAVQVKRLGCLSARSREASR
ncbi:MAG: hypothetical protein ACJ74U_07810 [Jatrophihabitantaceae bacterium]